MTSQPDTAKKTWADYGSLIAEAAVNSSHIGETAAAYRAAKAILAYLEKTFPDGPPPPAPPARRPFQVGDRVDCDGVEWEVAAPERTADDGKVEVAVWRNDCGYNGAYASDFTLITPAGEAE